MSIKEFKLPDPGEGLTEAEVVTWKVKVGDTVKINDIVVEIETAKSLVELPVPFAGRVEAILVPEGEEVAVGTPIITIQTDTTVQPGDGGDAAPASAPPVPPVPPVPPARGSVDEGAREPGMIGSPAPKVDPTVTGGGDDGEQIEEGKIGGTTSTGRTAVLVGYGVKQTEAVRRPRGAAPTSTPSPPPTSPPPTLIGSPDKREPVQTSQPRDRGPKSGEAVRALAKPPVRKLAKDLGVELSAVTGSGADGIVTRADVEAYAASGGSADQHVAAADQYLGWADGEAADPSTASGSRAMAARGIRETRTPVKGVRKVTAQAMVDSAFTAPHVTEWVTCDVTATMELVERLKTDREFREVKVTPLLVLAKAMCIAVRRHPGINVSWDEAAQEIVTKHYVNLGIAAATPRGLMVPNIKDADTLTLLDLARAIGQLTATARDGRTQPADMTGGTITITNVGVFGVDTGTPILNKGEAAIVAFGAVRRMPWVVTATDGTETIEPRWVTQLGMSFDHRMVDGELGSRYLADVAAILSDPSRALIWG